MTGKDEQLTGADVPKGESMEEDFYKVWTAEEYDKQPRPEGWLIMGDSHGEEDGPACAVDPEDAAFEWGKVYMRDNTGIAFAVVEDDAGNVTRWTLHRRVRVEIDVEEYDGDSVGAR